MKLSHFLGAATAVLVLAGCGPKMIPGTNIEDSPDTHEILAILEKYRSAVENRDVNTILALVSTDFHDSGGSANPEEALDYNALAHKLPDRLARIDQITLELSIRGVSVKNDVGNAVYYYTEHFRLLKVGNKPLNDGGIKQMWFKRINNHWKITSGI